MKILFLPIEGYQTPCGLLIGKDGNVFGYESMLLYD